jgi:hypothetical protein
MLDGAEDLCMSRIPSTLLPVFLGAVRPVPYGVRELFTSEEEGFDAGHAGRELPSSYNVLWIRQCTETGDGMDKAREDLEKDFAELNAMTADGKIIGMTERVMIKCTLALGATTLRLDEDIKRLDRTSTLLSKTSIAIGVIVLLVGVLQLYVMLRGH